MSTAMEIAARELEKLIKAADTPTNLFDELAGEGRTTETVKGNADDLAAHKADSAQGTGNFARYIFGANARGTTGWGNGVNNTVKSGFYYVHSNFEGLPIASSGYMIQVQNDTQDGFALQFFHDNWSNQLFVRRKTSGTFQDWYELMPLYRGAGNPEGVIAAKPGSFYLRDSGELWVKKTGTGNTGWRQVTVS